MSEIADEAVVKLVHYFIVKQGYNPVILHGAKDEIWLEDLNGEFNIVRIVSNYIHNNEQLEFDQFKTMNVLKGIKKKTFSFKLKVVSFYVNLGENVVLPENTNTNIMIKMNSLDELYKDEFVKNYFSTIEEDTNFEEEGVELLTKITEDIGAKTATENKKAEEIFGKKKPIVTNIIISINVILFVMMYVFGKGSEDSQTLLNFGAFHPLLVNYYHEYYRLITSGFLHIGIAHLLFNNYALYIIGSQVETFFGRARYIIIYLSSIIIGNLLSMIFVNGISAGASGGIFGLLGAILFFGYHYRVYFGTFIKSQIIPVILLNLFIGFALSGINNFAHIGGLIGGVLASMMVGIKYKTSKSDNMNGTILFLIFSIFLIYLGFFQ